MPLEDSESYEFNELQMKVFFAEHGLPAALARYSSLA